ncbi:Cell differentiation protein rcd1 [Pichia californica]|nr:Cell differentiation protein rcd1 [[Candida] californica]
MLNSIQGQQPTNSANAGEVNLSTENQNELNNNSTSGTGAINSSVNDKMVYSWITEFAYGPNKEQALLELGKKREMYDDLALVLWNSFGVISCLLAEIVSVYPLLSPPNLTIQASNRVCNALALMQCIASHPETRGPFLLAQIPLFLYPFLNTTSKQRPFEYLRLTSLGVIGALVKNDTPEVIQFLLTTEIIPLCLKIMESSSELNKTVAIFIVQKILLDDSGLNYICQTYDRFDAVAKVLASMVKQLVEQPTTRFLRHLIKCYLRLTDNMEARNTLKKILPVELKDGTFSQVLKEDENAQQSLDMLLRNLQ